jgi:hypothetical protein
MNCRECQDWLQRRLDGEVLAPPSALEQHLAECSSCRILHASGRVLRKGLKVFPAPVPPMNLSQRLAALVLEDRRTRRRRVRLRLAITAALAASVLVMALGGHFLPPVPRSTTSGLKHIARESTKEASIPIEKADASPRIGKSVEEARQAFASLSERWAERAKEQTKVFLSAATPIDIDMNKLSNVAVSLEPAAQSLQKAGQGALESLEPVAMSARRALTYFLNELPVFEENH